jgi:hypothetical protein
MAGTLVPVISADNGITLQSLTVPSPPASGFAQLFVESGRWYEQDEYGNIRQIGQDVISGGLEANRPTQHIAGRFYFATDTEVLWWDTGIEWRTHGDMNKGDYDTNDDGIVDGADLATSALFATNSGSALFATNAGSAGYVGLAGSAGYADIAELVEGVNSAAIGSYYGTDAYGTVGFHSVSTGGGSGAHIIQDNGSDLDQQARLNFVGFEVSAGCAGTATAVSPPKLDNCGEPDDNTDLDVSITAHGLVPKAPNDGTMYLRGDGTWARAFGSAHTIEDEGVVLPNQAVLNFIGAGVTAASAPIWTAVTIPGVAGDPIWAAAGDIVYGTGASAAAHLHIGESGQTLVVNEAGTAPEWVSGADYLGVQVFCM